MQFRNCILLYMLSMTASFTNGQFFIGTKLPLSAIPNSYEITLETKLEEKSPTFAGNVTINLTTVERSNNITLHASSNLHINKDDIVLKKSDGEINPVLKTEIDRFAEHYIIVFKNEFQKTEDYQLTITYSGELRNDNEGFYLAKYQDENGIERLLATTFFTRSSARSAFPCFDEPALKAKFVIQLIRPENYSSISNEEKIDTVDLGNGKFLDVFKETTNMSTYLVAFTISDFDHTSKNGLHQIFARPQAIKNEKLEFALKESSQILKAVEEYVDMKFTLSKIDHVAIPEQYFSKEALENWGLITYNERALLYCNKTSTSLDKQGVVTTMLHELIHQWFGNSVTPSDWKYLWLSEGFATYLQFRIGDSIKPEWKLMEQFHNIVLERAFEGENFFVSTALNDERQSDWVAYLKAASIIKMMEHFLTPKVFRTGLQLYLKNSQFGAVEPSDLYKALQTAVDENGVANLLGHNSLSSIMQTWDNLPSYPIVNVTRDYKNGQLTFEQGKFLPYEFRKIEIEHKWYIPINYVFNAESTANFSKTTADYWLTEKFQTLDNKFTTDGWLIVNKQFSGYYRVNYDLTNWNRLISFLNSPNFKTIHVLNRAQLIDDSFDLAKLGILNYKIPLELSTYLLQEQNYVPLSSFFNAFEFLNKCLSTSDIYPDFKNYVVNNLSSLYERLGCDENEDDNHLDKLNRAIVLKWLCALGHFECRQVGLQKLKNWKLNATVIPPNLQEPLLCGAIRLGNQDDWDFLYKKYEAVENSLEKDRILKALSCSENAEIITKFLGIIFDTSSTLRIGDRATATVAIIESGQVGLAITTTYVRQHFREFLKLDSAVTILDTIGSRLTTDQESKELTAFKNEHRGMHMAFRPGMAHARANLEWRSKHLAQITEWFNDRTKSNTTN